MVRTDMVHLCSGTELAVAQAVESCRVTVRKVVVGWGTMVSSDLAVYFSISLEIIPLPSMCSALESDQLLPAEINWYLCAALSEISDVWHGGGSRD